MDHSGNGGPDAGSLVARRVALGRTVATLQDQLTALKPSLAAGLLTHDAWEYQQVKRRLADVLAELRSVNDALRATYARSPKKSVREHAIRAKAVSDPHSPLEILATAHQVLRALDRRGLLSGEEKAVIGIIAKYLRTRLRRNVVEG